MFFSGAAYGWGTSVFFGFGQEGGAHNDLCTAQTERDHHHLRRRAPGERLRPAPLARRADPAPDHAPAFSFAGMFKGEGVVIPWGAVVMMGEDVILVNLPGGPRESDPKM